MYINYKTFSLSRKVWLTCDIAYIGDVHSVEINTASALSSRAHPDGKVNVKVKPDTH